MLIPLVDSIPMKFSTKEIAYSIGYQTAITKDNVHLKIDGVVFYRIVDPVKASYEISNAHNAVVQLAQTTMRAEIGKIELDKTFSERQMLNTQIVEQIQKTAEGWGVSVLRYEIMNIDVPKRIEESMELEAEAERNKRKTVLESMAQRERIENIATGEKIARILNAEAEKVEQEQLAEAEAFTIQKKANATAEAINRVAHALSQEHGSQAVSYHIARDYIEAFSRLAKEGNTLIVPANVGDASGMIAQAASVFGNVYKSQQAAGVGAGNAGGGMPRELERAAGAVVNNVVGNGTTGVNSSSKLARGSSQENDDTSYSPISPAEAAKRLKEEKNSSGKAKSGTNNNSGRREQL